MVNVKVTWKSIVCGFPGYDINGKITCLNYIIGIIAYSILVQTVIANLKGYCIKNMIS